MNLRKSKAVVFSCRHVFYGPTVARIIGHGLFISRRRTLCREQLLGHRNITSTNKTETLNKEQADTLVLRLTEDERKILLSALQGYQARKVRVEYEGQLAAIRWRSKFGRPSKVPNVGDVDPTGSFCPVPEDWLMRKYAETVPPPSPRLLVHVAIHNAIPFVGFGFLDNAIMIIAHGITFAGCPDSLVSPMRVLLLQGFSNAWFLFARYFKCLGDYIDLYVGSVMTISTLAAAALGNTFSDVLGIGSAWYVESMATKIGIKAPELSPIQLDMKSARWASNIGRCVGVTVGCLLGMLPLLFMNKSEEKDKKKEGKPDPNVENTKKDSTQ